MQVRNSVDVGGSVTEFESEKLVFGHWHLVDSYPLLTAGTQRFKAHGRTVDHKMILSFALSLEPSAVSHLLIEPAAVICAATIDMKCDRGHQREWLRTRRRTLLGSPSHSKD